MVAGLGPGPPARDHTVLGHKLPATTGRRCETRERIQYAMDHPDRHRLALRLRDHVVRGRTLNREPGIANALVSPQGVGPFEQPRMQSAASASEAVVDFGVGPLFPGA